MGCGGSKGKGEAAGGAPPDAKSKGPVDDKNQAKVDNKDFQAAMMFLSKVALFKRLPRDEHPLLAQNMVSVPFKAGDVVIEEGDTGSEFFVIQSGEASVLVGGKAVTTLKGGDYFGENALLRDEPRTATIKATSELKCLKITREKFTELGLNNKIQFANRKAVGAGGAVRTLEIKPPSPKTPEEKEFIAQALKNNKNLQAMVTLDEHRLASLVDICWKESVEKDTEIIKEGDLNADYFYVVQEGSFEIVVLDQADPDGPQSLEKKASVAQDSKIVSHVTKGGSFGELALLYLVPRAATVKAKDASVVWVIDRQNFKKILMQASSQKIDEYIKYLGRVEILEPLLSEEKHAVAEALVEMHFARGETILQQGEPGNTFYILYEGEVEIVKDEVAMDKLTASKKSGEARIFGERALMNNEPRAATVKVLSETAKALALDRDSFQMLLGPLEDIIKRNADGGKKSLVKGRGGKADPNDKSRDKILRRDLTKLGLLGCGGFGTVELYEHKVTKETYAMKGLSKGYIVKTGMQESVMNEKNILLMTNSQFIIKLWETYNGTQTLYFLLEPALGGELYATYNRKGFHGSEKHAKYYVAGTVLGFNHLHERRIIYRDLKPENLLMNSAGNLKITDMGLAKFVIGKTYTTCGTPDYFAPELIASTGHTNAVDWWCLGILIFELMSGHPPFESAYPMQIYSKVMNGISKVQFPAKCGGATGDLIKALLKKEPSERLPMRPGGVKNLQDHKWFGGFDWESCAQNKLDVPYKPVVKSSKDLANFSARKEDMPRQIEYHDDGSKWDEDFATQT